MGTGRRALLLLAPLLAAAGCGSGSSSASGPPRPTAPILVVAPPAIDFGVVAVGSSADRTVSVANSGLGGLSGMATTTGGPFAIVGFPAYDLGAGFARPVTVRFAPTATGAVAGSVLLTGAGGGVVSLSGAGGP
jgi:hypothetical protein